jgi:hypothetical protein
LQLKVSINQKELKKKYETMRNRLASFRQMEKEYKDLQKDNHEFQKVGVKDTE